MASLDELQLAELVILESKARWSGDYVYANEVVKRIRKQTSKSDRSGFPQFIIDSIVKSADQLFATFPFGLNYDLFVKGSAITEEGTPEVPILVSRNFRAVVSLDQFVLNGTSVSMRGYCHSSLDDKLLVSAVSKCARKTAIGFADERDDVAGIDAESIVGDGAISWLATEELPWLITFDEFSLIHALLPFFYLTPKRVLTSDIIFSSLRQIFKNLEDALE